MLLKIYSLLTLLTAIGSFSIGTLVLIKRRELLLNKIWFFLCIVIGGWNLGYYFTMSKGISRNIALLSSRISHASGILIALLFFHFIVTFLEINNQYKKRVTLSYVTCIILSLLSLTNFVVTDLVPKLDMPFYPIGKIGYAIYVFIFIFWVIYAHILAFRYYPLLTGYKRNQLKYFLVGTILGFFGGANCFPLIFGIPIHPFLSTLIIIYIFTTSYVIFRYRMMDITVAITRAGIFIIVYTLVLGIPLGLTAWGRYWLQGLFGTSWYWASMILAIILATLGPFIYIYINRKAEERLLKQQRQYQNTLKQASLGMTRIRNLRKLLDLITHIVTKSVGISYAAIYLHNRETGEYVLQVSRDKDRMPIIKLTPDNPLIAWIMVRREPLIYEEVKRRGEDANDSIYKLLEENMRLLTATLVIPSFLEDRLVGFFVLGEKISGQIYTPDDLNVFQVLASQAALAIENARFFEETKQMQEQIAVAEKMATVGTMADGLSHQINNRFYALSLIAADTIDTIKMIDTSNCSPEVKEGFNQVGHALERIKANVMQGGEVVKGILKYTRKGEEGLEALTLDQILDSTLDMVQYKVNLSEIDIIRNYPKDHPKIRGNSVQLQEVFFNFIDNGYDSTVERKTILKEAGYRGRITFSYQAQENGTLLITAEDNGMGIKEEDKKKLFTPFFTTKVSSRQGTGLGLYVIKRVIEEFHKGKIWFESGYGKGTRFFIQLPIAKE